MTLNLYTLGHSPLLPEPLGLDIGPLLSVARSGDHMVENHKRVTVGASVPPSPQPMLSACVTSLQFQEQPGMQVAGGPLGC